jgi:hypothetical protein
MDAEPLRAAGCHVVEGDVLESGPVIRHDPRKLALAILALAAEVRA